VKTQRELFSAHCKSKSTAKSRYRCLLWAIRVARRC